MLVFLGKRGRKTVQKVKNYGTIFSTEGSSGQKWLKSDFRGWWEMGGFWPWNPFFPILGILAPVGGGRVRKSFAEKIYWEKARKHARNSVNPVLISSEKVGWGPDLAVNVKKKFAACTVASSSLATEKGWCVCCCSSKTLYPENLFINSVHTRCIIKTSGFTRGVCKSRGFC